MKAKLLFAGFFLLNLFFYTARSQTYLVSMVPEETSKCGYMDLNGKIIVEALYCIASHTRKKEQRLLPTKNIQNFIYLTGWVRKSFLKKI